MTTLEALDAKRRELEARIAHRELVTVERHADPLDDVYQYTQREVAAGELSRETELLKRIEDAIERCRRGHYGVCIDCGQRIPKRRLRAVPWAERCRWCEERMEAEG